MGNGIKNKKPGHELKEGFLELEIGFPKPSGPRNRLFGGQPCGRLPGSVHSHGQV
jgi:hypothetical protein